MNGQSMIAMPIARLLEIAGAKLRAIRKRAQAPAEKPVTPDENGMTALYYGQMGYDSVWGGRTTTGAYVVGRLDDGTYRFVCFL